MYHENTGLKILVLHMLSGFEHFEAVSMISLPSHQMEYFPVPFYQCFYT